MRDTAPKVIKIPANPDVIKTATTRRQLRVAAYCRVSTKEEDQANSYDVQKEYYTDKIMGNPDWTMGASSQTRASPVPPQKNVRTSCE